MRYPLRPIRLAVFATLLGFTNSVVTAQTRPSADSTIVVLPFATPPSAADPWLGKAVQQDLVIDLTQGTHARVVSPSDVPPADSEKAMQSARNLGATIVVFGQVQSAGSDVRITGRVMDVNTSRTLKGLKATGPLTELFRLEDAFAAQVFAALPGPMLTDAATQGVQQFNAATRAAGPGAPADGSAPAPPVVVYGGQNYYAPPEDNAPSTYYSPPTGDTYNYYGPPADSYGYAYSGPGYGYGYSGYGYPYYGAYPFWGSFFVSGFGFCDLSHHHHDDGHHHGNWADQHGQGNFDHTHSVQGMSHVPFSGGTASGVQRGFHTPIARGGFGGTGGMSPSHFRGQPGGMRGPAPVGPRAGGMHGGGAVGGGHR